jgi:hypothetical protein
VVECILIDFCLRLGGDMVYEMATWNNEKGIVSLEIEIIVNK